MGQALSGSTLYINNELIEYMPNSLTYVGGSPERLVTPQVSGNGATTNVVSEDYSTSKGEVKFDLKTTSENEEKISDWIFNLDQNVVKIVSLDAKARIFQGATIVNRPEFNLGADGVVSIEIESKVAAVA